MRAVYFKNRPQTSQIKRHLGTDSPLEKQVDLLTEVSNYLEYELEETKEVASVSTVNTPLSTDSFKIFQVGFYSYRTNAMHPEYYYPNPTDYHPPGLFYVGQTGTAAGDFNGDGHQDLLVSWTASPHTIPNNLNLVPTLFLNDGTGALQPANQAFIGAVPQVHMPYRPVVADFNGDGVDDFVMAGSGVIQRNPDGTYTNQWDPVTLVLSQPGGKVIDASTWIEGQENGG